MLFSVMVTALLFLSPAIAAQIECSTWIHGPLMIIIRHPPRHTEEVFMVLHSDLEPKLKLNKTPQKKRGADNDCMRCNDVSIVYENPGECRPFSKIAQIRFPM